MRCIPAVYHPTTIALVDDDPDLLDGLSLILIDQYKLKTFAFASLAKTYLLKHCKSIHTKKSFYTEGDHYDAYNVNIHLEQFISRLCSSKRFETIGVAILDFDIPDLNGLELARILKSHLPIKIIMLTGVADLHTAIDALNRKEIDQFVLKSDPNHAAVLRETIQLLQQDYFVEQYQGVADALNKDGTHPLYDLDFIKIFQKICVECQIIEYCLLTSSGSLLMRDANGKEFLLVVNTEADFIYYRNLAEDDDNASIDLRHSLKHKEKVVFTTEDAVTPYVKDWLICDAYKVKGKKIYYAVAEKICKQKSSHKKFISYHQFLSASP